VGRAALAVSVKVLGQAQKIGCEGREKPPYPWIQIVTAAVPSKNLNSGVLDIEELSRKVL
jgi:hypothetical protein